jgi:predicted transcriptional regulator YdeE
MHTTHQAQAIRIIGIELRTSNAVAAQTIPPLWRRFFEQGVLAQIPGKLSDEVYAVYTHFENAGVNNDGTYSLIIGAPVSSTQEVPAGMSHTVIPASQRAVFEVPQGQPQQVGAVWQSIWQRHDLAKTYVADYERYGADGKIDIHIGLAN